jgi:hypothetical protein
MAFAMGMYLCLSVHGSEGLLDDEPEMANHIAKLAKLREATVDRTVCARFRDKKGLSADLDDGIVAYSYESASGPAVIVASVGKPGNAKIVLDRGCFENQGSSGVTLKHLDGSVTSSTIDAIEVRLCSNEVLVCEY